MAKDLKIVINPWKPMVVPGYEPEEKPEKPTKHDYYLGRAMKAINVWQDETDLLLARNVDLRNALNKCVTHCFNFDCDQIASWRCKAYSKWYDHCREHRPEEKTSDIFLEEQDQARDAMEY